jgi:hypothetical protein
MRFRVIFATLVAASLLSSLPALAQQRHVVDPATMHQAIAAQAVTDQQNRGAVLDVLKRAEVRQVADHLGLNVSKAENAVASLDGAELARLAASARAADAQLAGGSSTVIISATTLLLIIIIVILVAN